MEKKRHLVEVRAHVMKGAPPKGFQDWPSYAESIPVYDTVDKALLYEDDPKPFHIVLDVAVLGARSANGLVYDETLMSAYEAQLPGLGGLRGHLSEGEWSAYPIEAVDWIGHERVGDTLYAKGYIAPGEHRNAVRRQIARGGKIKTSLDVKAYQEWVDKKAGTYRLYEIEFFTLDLVHGNKAALAHVLSGDVFITRETEELEKPMPPEEKQETTDGNIKLTTQYVESLNTKISTLEAERTELNSKLDAAEKELQETRQYASIVGSIRLSFGYGEDVSNEAIAPKMTEMYTILESAAKRLGVDFSSITVAVEEMITARETAERQEAERRLDGVVGSFTENWRVTNEDSKAKVAKLHKQFKRALQLETAQEGETLEALATRVWNEDFKEMADSLVQSLGGPSAVVSGKVGGQGKKAELSEAQIKNAKRFLPTK